MESILQKNNNFRRKASSDCYISEGMDKIEFIETESNMNDLM